MLVGEPGPVRPGRRAWPSRASGPPDVDQLGSDGRLRVVAAREVGVAVQGDVDCRRRAPGRGSPTGRPRVPRSGLEVHGRVRQVEGHSRRPRGHLHHLGVGLRARPHRRTGGAGCRTRRGAGYHAAEGSTSSSVVGEHAGRVGAGRGSSPTAPSRRPWSSSAVPSRATSSDVAGRRRGGRPPSAAGCPGARGRPRCTATPRSSRSRYGRRRCPQSKSKSFRLAVPAGDLPAQRGPGRWGPRGRTRARPGPLTSRGDALV